MYRSIELYGQRNKQQGNNMVTIETEHGTFEGETLKDASKKARQAAQAAKKQAVKDEADRKIAYLRAKEHGYEIYRVREEEKGNAAGLAALSAGLQVREHDGDIGQQPGRRTLRHGRLAR